MCNFRDCILIYIYLNLQLLAFFFFSPKLYSDFLSFPSLEVAKTWTKKSWKGRGNRKIIVVERWLFSKFYVSESFNRTAITLAFMPQWSECWQFHDHTLCSQSQKNFHLATLPSPNPISVWLPTLGLCRMSTWRDAALKFKAQNSILKCCYSRSAARSTLVTRQLTNNT
jgi:hypothetical protein